MTDMLRGRIYRAHLAHIGEEKFFLVVSNDGATRAFEQVLAARLTTTPPKAERPAMVPLGPGEARQSDYRAELLLTRGVRGSCRVALVSISSSAHTFCSASMIDWAMRSARAGSVAATVLATLRSADAFL